MGIREFSTPVKSGYLSSGADYKKTAKANFNEVDFIKCPHCAKDGSDDCATVDIQTAGEEIAKGVSWSLTTSWLAVVIGGPVGIAIGVLISVVQTYDTLSLSDIEEWSDGEFEVGSGGDVVCTYCGNSITDASYGSLAEDVRAGFDNMTIKR
jgi:hypothetical protein